MNRTPNDDYIFRALSQIETPSCDIESTVRARLSARPKARRLPAPRLAVAVLTALLALTLTVGALIGLPDSWMHFFGADVRVPESIVLKLNERKTIGDYTFTIENALTAEDAALVLLSLSRADGQPLDPGIGIGNFGQGPAFLVDGEHAFGSIGGMSPYMSPDNTVKHWSMELMDSDVNLLSKTLTVKISKIVQPSIYIGAVTGNLDAVRRAAQSAPAALISTPQYSNLSLSDAEGAALRASIIAQKEAARAVSLPLEEEYPNQRFAGVATIDGRLALLLEISEGNGAQSETHPEIWRKGVGLHVIDTRTGWRYKASSVGHFTKFDEGNLEAPIYAICSIAAEDDSMRLANFTQEDLPYLKLEAEYNLFTDLIPQPISLSFVAKSRPALTLPLTGTVEFAGNTATLRRAVITPLGITIYCGDIDPHIVRDLHAEDIPLQPGLLLKNGTRITHASLYMHDSEGEAPDELVALGYRPRTDDGSRVFSDTEQLQSIIICGTEYPIA